MAHDKSSLYREAILEHARNPRNAGTLDDPSLTGEAVNPLCGDALELTLSVSGGVIRDVRVQVRGCVISQAASSMMSELLTGQPMEQAVALGAAFQSAMEGQEEALPESLESLQPLLAVRKHRSRIRCALLPWEALERLHGPS